jgi:formate dehydrogenase subunit delta
MAADGTLKTLIRMANQIADFFQPYSEEQCIAGVQDHIKKFWTPQMRRDLDAHLQHGGEGVKPAVIEAFNRLARVESPARRASAGPAEVGEAFSDAG